MQCWMVRLQVHASPWLDMRRLTWQRSASTVGALVRAECISLFCGRAGVRLLRAAVLAAVARERPGEAEPLALARSHFGCTREAAADLLRSAQVRPAGNALHL